MYPWETQENGAQWRLLMESRLSPEGTTYLERQAMPYKARPTMHHTRVRPRAPPPPKVLFTKNSKAAISWWKQFALCCKTMDPPPKLKLQGLLPENELLSEMWSAGQQAWSSGGKHKVEFPKTRTKQHGSGQFTWEDWSQQAVSYFLTHGRRHCDCLRVVIIFYFLKGSWFEKVTSKMSPLHIWNHLTFNGSICTKPECSEVVRAGHSNSPNSWLILRPYQHTCRT